MCLVNHTLARTELADSLLTELIATVGDSEYSNIARVYAFRGNPDETFKWLNLALDNKDLSVIKHLNSPFFQICL